MAGLEHLIQLIYHEKQQEGSMLCAQHALNSLLQEHYFTAPDLSDIAKNLDVLEERYDDNNTGNASTNMDDTGFFSVQVLDNALKVWGLNLIRWRGEEMRPYQGHPHTQLAFILNLQQHWFTLRRFGSADPNIERDSGNGHWFNLNSFLPAPEWVGKTYLGMVLQQAEAEGYSVFTVTQADPDAPLALIRTEADEVASTLPEPSSAARPNNETLDRSSSSAAGTATQGPRHEAVEGFEDEDYELQAALQASLGGGGAGYTHYTEDVEHLKSVPFVSHVAEEQHSASVSSSSTPDSGSHTPAGALPPLAPDLRWLNLPPNADVDPVTASMERNRVMLQRMREQQEFAQREMWLETGLHQEENATTQARREQRQREEEEEAEQLRLALEESEALAKQYRANVGQDNHDDDHNQDDDDDDDFVMADGLHGQSSAIGSHPPGGGHRVYDDDDAELQAALKASLENVPEGYEHPELQPRPTPSYPCPVSVPALSDAKDARSQTDTESVASDDTNLTESAASEATAELPTLDEIRRKRLARFGL